MGMEKEAGSRPREVKNKVGVMPDATKARLHFGFNCGNRITSRMLSWPSSIMHRRSMPMPMMNVHWISVGSFNFSSEYEQAVPFASHLDLLHGELLDDDSDRALQHCSPYQSRHHRENPRDASQEKYLLPPFTNPLSPHHSHLPLARNKTFSRTIGLGQMPGQKHPTSLRR